MSSLSRSMNIIVIFLLYILLFTSIHQNVVECQPTNSTSNLPPITVSDKSLIVSTTGQRFYVIGATYEFDVDDMSISNWQPALDRLIEAIPKLNTIRFYQINPSKQYRKLMQYLQSNKIYAIIPLIPLNSYCVLNSAGTTTLSDPNTCYPSCILTFGQQVISQFAIYTNTLAFIAAENVMSSDKAWHAAACVKSYVADLKQYQLSCWNQRYVPIMVAENDSPLSGYNADQNHQLKLGYLTCNSAAQSIDIYGVNFFRWCSDSCTSKVCGWDSLLHALQTSPVPIILSSYGCGTFGYGGTIVDYGNGTVTIDSSTSSPGQRSWKQTAVLYSTPYRDVFSGGVAVGYTIENGGKSFFSGGDLFPSGLPGPNKACGNPNKVCNIDLYSNQLAATFPAGSSNPSGADAQVQANLNGATKSTTATTMASTGLADNLQTHGALSNADQAALDLEASLDNNSASSVSTSATKLARQPAQLLRTALFGSGRTRVNAQKFSIGAACPTVLNLDLTPASSRQNADGYTFVQCGVGYSALATSGPGSAAYNKTLLAELNGTGDQQTGRIVAIVAACLVGCLMITALIFCLAGRRCTSKRALDEPTLHDYKNDFVWKRDRHQDHTDKLPKNAVPDPLVARIAAK